MTTKNYGAGVSGYRNPDGRCYETTVFQASKLLVDAEINFVQDAVQFMSRPSHPSGWLSSDFLSRSDVALFEASTTANTLKFPPLYASVNGWSVVVKYTNSATANVLDLGAGPSGAGSKRTDLVVLEVWRKLLSPAPSTDGKSASGRVWFNGNIKVALADDATLNLADDILDATAGAETTKRVQIQYRLRVIPGVDIVAYPRGITDPGVVANSTPVSSADPDGEATMFGYYADTTDPGLWVAGDGDPSNDLGTVDGYMYAIPLLAVVRRNTSAFDRNTNHSGGVAYPGPSDRPDGLFHDIVAARDVIDLRTGVSANGWNYQEVLEKNLGLVFDNALRMEAARTAIGGGSDGTTVLWADEIGLLPGDGVDTGDTPGAEFIGQFDSVRRTFSDRVVHETVWLKYSPVGANWATNEVVTIDPSALPVYPKAAFNWASKAPSNVSIVRVGRCFFAHSTIGQVPLADDHVITGLGEVPQGSVFVTIGTSAPAGHPLYVEVEIAYPSGVGLTKTPTNDFGSGSVVVNNPSANPVEYEAIHDSSLNWPNRELTLTYRTTSQSFAFESDGSSTLVIPERAESVLSVTVNGTPYGGVISVDPTGYVIIDEGSTGFGATSGDSLVVSYKAVRPYQADTVQCTIFYEAAPAMTVPDGFLGTSLAVVPRYIAPYLYVVSAGSGAQSDAYPYPFAYMAGAVYPSTSTSFYGDHELDGAASIYTTNFSTSGGFVKLETKIPMVPAADKLVFERVPGDVDAEGRSFFKSVPTSNYAPSSVAQPLSDPKRHKVLQPLLVELPEGTAFGRKGTLALVIVSRWAEFDDLNQVGFLSDLIDNTTSASIYRVRGNLLNNRRD